MGRYHCRDVFSWLVSYYLAFDVMVWGDIIMLWDVIARVRYFYMTLAGVCFCIARNRSWLLVVFPKHKNNNVEKIGCTAVM